MATYKTDPDEHYLPRDLSEESIQRLIREGDAMKKARDSRLQQLNEDSLERMCLDVNEVHTLQGGGPLKISPHLLVVTQGRIVRVAPFLWNYVILTPTGWDRYVSCWTQRGCRRMCEAHAYPVAPGWITPSELHHAFDLDGSAQMREDLLRSAERVRAIHGALS